MDFAKGTRMRYDPCLCTPPGRGLLEYYGPTPVGGFVLFDTVLPHSRDCLHVYVIIL